MPFPKSPREVYTKNPLEEVICQIRFPAILEITATSPVLFQNKIRSDYPWYEEQAGGPALPQEIIDLLANLPVPQSQPEHRFSTEDRTRSISLTQNFVAVADYEYQNWADFRKEVKLAEEVLRSTYLPSFYTRVGLRYRDVLVRERYGLQDVPWSELLNPSFIGVLGDQHLSEDVQESQARSLLSIPDVEGGFVLLEQGLAVSRPEDSQAYLIDADFFTEKRSESNDAFDALDRFNKWGGHLFRWATTDTLRGALQPLCGRLNNLSPVASLQRDGGIPDHSTRSSRIS